MDNGEIRDEKNEPKKENLGKDQSETANCPPYRLENASWVGMAEKPKEVCLQQGVPANNV